MASELPSAHVFKPRNLVLLFDGTTGTFSSKISNIPILCSLLSRDTRDQISYYQTGIGTYSSFYSPRLKIMNAIDRAMDDACAWNLDQHVCDGYKFLMQYYQPGDHIYLFGFSRGAYTARALAGMLQVMGLLGQGNFESVSLAYSIYSGKHNAPFSPAVPATRESSVKEELSLSEAFKEAFCREVCVHMIGVFDTVASVGVLVPQGLPFASGNSHITHFRQALALDEHRTRFMPQMWMGTDDDEKTVKVQTTLPVNGETVVKKPTFLMAKYGGPNNPGATMGIQPSTVGLDTPPTTPSTENIEISLVPAAPLLTIQEELKMKELHHHDNAGTRTHEEVWFSGGHCDIGGFGGIGESKLSNLSMIWMIREAIECGLKIDPVAILESTLFTPYIELVDKAFEHKQGTLLEKAKLIVRIASLSTTRPDVYMKDSYAARSDTLSFSIVPKPGLPLGSRFKAFFDRANQRAQALGWWILELTPGVKVAATIDGTPQNWYLSWNAGRGRLLPTLDDGKKHKFHMSVKLRRDAGEGILAAEGVKNGTGVYESKYAIKARFPPNQSVDTHVEWVE